MKKKILLAFVTLVLMLSIVLTGCAAGGVPQTQYDNLAAQLTDAQSKLTKAQGDLSTLQSQKTAVDADLQVAKADVSDLQKQVTDLEKQVNDLKAQYELTGLTAVQMAEKIVQNYHATHVYSTTDLFICGDMSSEVWNMLKAENINARIVVGRIDAQIANILDSNHAWVLAEVNPGEYLALETTLGNSVTQSKNPLYYHGWYFNSPADLKANNDLIKEYNIRVDFRNLLNSEVTNAMNLYNNSSNQVEADKWMALYTKLKELKAGQEDALNTLLTEIHSFAKQF